MSVAKDNAISLRRDRKTNMWQVIVMKYDVDPVLKSKSAINVTHIQTYEYETFDLAQESFLIHSEQDVLQPLLNKLYKGE